MRRNRCPATRPVLVFAWAVRGTLGTSLTEPRHGLPPDRSDGRRRLLRQARQTPPPRRLGLPPLWRAGPPRGPPPPPCPGAGLPVRRLRVRLQRLDRPPRGGDPPPAVRADPDP